MNAALSNQVPFRSLRRAHAPARSGPTPMHLRTAPPRLTAFTIVELIVTIAIIATLAAISMAGLSSVRNSQKRHESLQLVEQLHQAMELYRQMDRRGKYPNSDPGDSMFADTGVGALLVSEAGYIVSRPRKIPTAAGAILGDAWGRGLRYKPDLVIDSSPTRPAPLEGWNPKGKEPYPYIWSLGIPNGDEETDAKPANAKRWLIHAEGN